MTGPPQWAMLLAAATSMASASWLAGITTLCDQVRRRAGSLTPPTRADITPTRPHLTRHMSKGRNDGAQDHGSESSSRRSSARWANRWSHGSSGGPHPTADRSVLRRIALGTAAGLGPFVVFGGPAGIVIGLVLGVAAVRLLAGVPERHTRRRHERLACDLPLALDLIAACLTAGAPVVTALEIVADAVGGPLGTELGLVGRALRLGAPIGEACHRLLDPGPGGRPAPSWWAITGVAEVTTAARELATFARALHRTEDSGARLAATLERLADQTRAQHQERALAAARRAGVAAVAPLGLCFLPAFIALGVVPVVAGAGTGLALL